MDEHRTFGGTAMTTYHVTFARCDSNESVIGRYLECATVAKSWGGKAAKLQCFQYTDSIRRRDWWGGMAIVLLPPGAPCAHIIAAACGGSFLEMR